MIEVKNLTKKYGDHTAVTDLSFTVEDGQIYGFLGPNGAGKTTVMNVMTGYLAATHGTVHIDGHEIFEEAELAKKSVGYLPENPPVYPDMTPDEYLRFIAELRGVPRAEIPAAVDKAVEAAGIGEVRNRLTRVLSKGFRQRVGLAGALVGDPKVVILDEPTVGLDPKQIIEIRSLISSLRSKHTVILSSHILSEVSSICDVVLIINKGKFVACDTPQKLSAKLNVNAALVLNVAANAQRVKKALSTCNKIKSARILENTAEGCRVSVTPKNDLDIRADVSKILVNSGCPILSMELTTLSLEEVFLALTQDEGEVSKR